MGLLDDLKMASGLGLNPMEAYRRAYEKGVLLGPAQFANAATMFGAAASRLQAVEPELARRAQANALLYGYLATGDPQQAWKAAEVLAGCPWIETPGTDGDPVEGARLRAELLARALEDQARRLETAGTPAAEHRRRAAQAWLPLAESRPLTLTLAAGELDSEDGLSRFFYNHGIAELVLGELLASRSPDEAAERLALARQAFARAGAEDLRERAAQQLKAVRFERPCWFCGRVVRGLGHNLFELPTVTSDYFTQLAGVDRERGTAWGGQGSIYACAACHGAVDGMAQVRAMEVRAELQQAMAEVQRQVGYLESRLRNVEARAHSHGG